MKGRPFRAPKEGNSIPAERAAGKSCSGERMSVSILVVDDEPDVVELFRQRFRRETREGT